MSKYHDDLRAQLDARAKGNYRGFNLDGVKTTLFGPGDLDILELRVRHIRYLMKLSRGTQRGDVRVVR
jgi:hypothetical protein